MDDRTDEELAYDIANAFATITRNLRLLGGSFQNSEALNDLIGDIIWDISPLGTYNLHLNRCKLIEEKDVL